MKIERATVVLEWPHCYASTANLQFSASRPVTMRGLLLLLQRPLKEYGPRFLYEVTPTSKGDSN